MRATIEPTGLTRRIIPCLDVAAGRVVKGVQFKNLTDHGDPTEAAARYAEEGADEIVFLDITAAPERRDTDLDWVRRTAEQVFIPLSVGGGVRSVDDGRKLLLAGADKLGINTAAVAEPELLTRLAERFGSQCVVLSVDAKRREAAGAGDQSWEVVTHGGRTPTGLRAVAGTGHRLRRGRHPRPPRRRAGNGRRGGACRLDLPPGDLLGGRGQGVPRSPLPDARVMNHRNARAHWVRRRPRRHPATNR